MEGWFDYCLANRNERGVGAGKAEQIVNRLGICPVCARGWCKADVSTIYGRGKGMFPVAGILANGFLHHSCLEDHKEEWAVTYKQYQSWKAGHYADRGKVGGPAIDLFPLRVRSQAVEAKASVEQHSFDPATSQAMVPDSLDALGRTIRLHEALHAIYSGKERAETVVEQATEDIRLHLNKAGLEGFARRDEVATALLDLRALATLGDEEAADPATADVSLAVFLRSLAILYNDASKIRLSGPLNKRGKYARLVKRAHARLSCKNKKGLGISVRAAFRRIANSDATKTASETLAKHFHKPDQPPQPKFTGPGTGKGGPKQLHQERLERQQKREDEEEAKLEVKEKYDLGEVGADDLLSEKDRNELQELTLKWEQDKISKKKHRKRYKQGYREDRIPEFTIVRLVQDSHRDTDQGPRPVGSYSGSRIRAKRLAAAAVSPVAVRLFERKKPAKGGGTLLIDASGSMHLTSEDLKEIISLVPSGTVAYYSGLDDMGTKGTMVIVAEKGKQYHFAPGEEPPHVMRGNDVDYEAMRWLLGQERPRYFVTDGGFTGSALTAIARRVFREAKARKLVIQIRSLGAVKQALQNQKSGAALTPQMIEDEEEF